MRAELKGEPLLLILFQTCSYRGKGYCFPAQLTLMKWLESYHGMEISIATINRWLRATEDLGWIKRKRRIKRDRRWGIMFQSTMYFMTIPGLFQLKRMGQNIREMFLRITGQIREAAKEAFKGGKKIPADRLGGFKSVGEVVSKILPAGP